MKTAIITGITGQDGAYLSELLLQKGYRVVGFTRSYNSANFDKLSYLGIKERIIIKECDLLDIPSIINNFIKYQPDEVYNLAAQSSVSLSFEQSIGTIQFNTISVLNLLEAIRAVNDRIKFYQASSSEMFGRVDKLPIQENTVFHPLSPYAISKASAHWAVINYRETYNMFACCGILFNHESYLRNKGFFIKKVICESFNIKNGKQDFLTVGNIDLKRDFGYAPYYVYAIWLMMQQDKADDYIICSGKSITLKDIIFYIFKKLDIDKNRLKIDENLYRPIDISNIYGDNSKAKQILGWKYDLEPYDLLDILINEEKRSTE